MRFKLFALLFLIVSLQPLAGQAQDDDTDLDPIKAQCIEALLGSIRKSPTQIIETGLRLEIEAAKGADRVFALLNITNERTAPLLTTSEFFKTIDRISSATGVEFYPWGEFNPKRGYGTVGISVSKTELLLLLAIEPNIKFVERLRNPEGLFARAENLVISDTSRPSRYPGRFDFARLERPSERPKVAEQAPAQKLFDPNGNDSVDPSEASPFNYFLTQLQSYTPFDSRLASAGPTEDRYLVEIMTNTLPSDAAKFGFWLEILKLQNSMVDDEEFVDSKMPADQLELIDQFSDSEFAGRAAEYIWNKNSEVITKFYSDMGAQVDPQQVKAGFKNFIFHGIERAESLTLLKFRR